MPAGSSDGIDASDGEHRRIARISDGGRPLRELALDSLRRADGPLPLAELACRVVAAERDGDPATVPREEVQRVYLSLARYQVPRLEQRGVVAYDEAEGTVRLTGPGTP